MPMDRVDIFTSRLRRLVSRTRWSTRLLGFPDEPREVRHDPGLVLIQIDGLSRKALFRALDEGQMPFLQQLLRREHYRLHPFYSGLPSSTPGFQAELFYGVRTAVPAFGYWDRREERVASMNEPTAAATVEERLHRRARGLFKGGAAWSNVFTGDAAEPHLCASSVGLGSLLGAIAPWRLAGLILFHGWSVVRVLANLVIELVLALWDLVRGTLAGRSFFRELRFVPLRVIVTAGFREIITAGAGIDAGRGLPVIQLNYLGYDEHAHRRGPASRFARWTLRGIDRSIRRVFLAAYRSRRRDYQVWIYSDHGQESVTPYPVRYGESVATAVKRVHAACRKRRFEARRRLRFSERNTGTGDRSRWVDQDLLDRLTPHEDSEKPVPTEDEPIVVHQGPVGFVYFKETMVEGELKRFAARLHQEAHIPLVMVHDGSGGAYAWTGGGDEALRLPADAARIFGEDHPHLEAVTEDMLRVVCHEDAGAVVLAGWDRREPFSLQMEFGSHGGPGPNETSPILILPPEVDPKPSVGSLRPRELRELALRVLDRPHLRFDLAAAGQGISGEFGGGAGVRLRVMTYNVHGCRGMDGQFSPERIARVIARSRPDIICLQELDQIRRRSGGIDQIEVIAEQLRANFQFHAVADVDDGSFGNAVLSCYPLRLIRSGPLPYIRSRINLEPRGALWVEAEVGARKVQILSTHLSIREKERRVQAEALAGPEWLGHPDCGPSVVLAGDFNTSSHSHAGRLIQKRLTDACVLRVEDTTLQTWSSRLPVRRIDHIFLSECFRPGSVHVPRSRLTRVASDHLPLVADITCRFETMKATDGAD